MPEKYPPVRFKAELRDTLQGRANDLALERGGGEISLPAYIAEASQFFEEHREHRRKANPDATA